MNPFIQIAQGAVGAILISLFFILRSSFGETRHTLSIIGAIILFIASGYILRTRLIRWGSRQVWLKYHQRLASLGLFLVLIHSAAQPPRLAFVDGVYTGTAQFWNRGCRQSYHPSRTTHPSSAVILLSHQFCCFPSFCTAEKS